MACSYKNAEVLELLIGFNLIDEELLSQECDSGWTPFHTACSNSKIDIMILLLNKGFVNDTNLERRNDSVNQ